GLLSLLGPNVSSFPFSESAYVEALKLRTEQEKTKQEYYKLETANKNLNIIQMALNAQVPSNLIPSMCVGIQNPNQDPRLRSHSQFPQSPLVPVVSTFQPGHSRSSSSKDIYGHDNLNANPIPPMQFKFGAGSLNQPSMVNRRPLSPAKIGAAAVANLATPTNTYRAKRTLPLHQRHFSMPVESSSRNLQQRATSSIQVKPSPAQPLHKQSRLSQPPSQESMTSFQHIIQFHHWKPESPGANP
ncbi:hypothetical protein HYPBUDRAFT_88454, partial [Hyphopichia burtonii NRRL Y-1933]